MKQKLIRLSRRYLSALRKHLEPGSRNGSHPALALGRQAVVLELEILGLARIHEESLATLDIPPGKKGHLKQAQLFFNEAITPIMETHQVARESRVTLNRMSEMLGRCTGQLAATNQQLKHGIVQRRTAEAALKTAGVDYARLLKESLRLQDGLRQLTHQVLRAQEDERKKISHELQDNVAQALLGINVRLCSLKHEARTSNKGFKNDIASTQRLVAKSAKFVQMVVGRLGKT